MKTRLSVHDLHVRYGATHALRGVTIDVASGEIVGVVGPNGAGKTSLLRCISRLVPAASGAVLFEGYDIRNWTVRDGVGSGIVLCAEGRRLFKSLTIEDNLRLGAYRLGLPWRNLSVDVDYVTGLFPVLRERWRQATGTLSGGEQQMVALARGLIARPVLLLLDEPTLGLAPRMAQGIFRALRDAASRGTAILIVEQNLRAVIQVATRGYLVRNGRVTVDGSPSGLRNRIESLDGYLVGPQYARR